MIRGPGSGEDSRREPRGPTFDFVPEVIGFVAHILLVAVVLWSLGFSFC
jgi:hypothetical protein